MRLFDLFICWFFGHTPESKMLEIQYEDVEEKITICDRCGVWISYLPDKGGWVKW